MSRYALFSLLAVAAAPSVFAQPDPTVSTPLADKHFAYPSEIPYQVDPSPGTRGPQQGFNMCNSTTENQNSNCQTAFVDSIDDFCLWAPMKPNSTIADTEGVEVAWCSKGGHGTRLIPEGALQGVQFMKTPDYLQVVGFIDQTLININAQDYGGELDPHGADLRGNPLGGLMYSNGFPSNNGNNNSYQQVIEWHNFMGGSAFCIKVCDPAGQHAADFCQHIYDRIGCAYNAPNNAQKGVFESCQGDNQDYPGVYTSNGQVVTYTQPAESLGPITTMPYQPKVPASSNCITYSSQALYTSLPAGSASASASGAKATGSGKGSGSPTKSGANTSATGGSQNSNGAAPAGVVGFTPIVSLISIVGTMFALSFFY